MGKGLPGGRRQAGSIDYRTEPCSSLPPDGPCTARGAPPQETRRREGRKAAAETAVVVGKGQSQSVGRRDRGAGQQAAAASTYYPPFPDGQRVSTTVVSRPAVGAGTTTRACGWHALRSCTRRGCRTPSRGCGACDWQPTRCLRLILQPIGFRNKWRARMAAVSGCRLAAGSGGRLGHAAATVVAAASTVAPASASAPGTAFTIIGGNLRMLGVLCGGGSAAQHIPWVV
jgi:hypothetical protein